jgi:quercetin dioxygenase-like cupin family protein
MAPEAFVDWHNAPRRQYVITLAGRVEIGLGDGSLHRFGPGEAILAEDLKGHTTRAVGDEPRVMMNNAAALDFDADRTPTINDYTMGIAKRPNR